jgi:hypothetical protein
MEKNFSFKDATQKSASMVLFGIVLIELEPWRPNFEKCPHLREKGGVLTLRKSHWVCADLYSTGCS